MKKIKLNDGTPIYCIKETEAIVLDEHIKGYFDFDFELQDGDIVIDVGANIGVFGLRLSQILKNIHIHAFEPIPEIHAVLKKNAKISLNNNFNTYRMGLSNKKDHIHFTYYPNSPALSTAQPEIWQDNHDNFIEAVKGSILNVPTNIWWAKFIPPFFAPLIAKYLKLNQKKVKSHVITISDFIEKNHIKKIDLLKIDCEGHEVKVLKGIKNNHWVLIKRIIMEVNDINNDFEIVKSILSKNGFRDIQSEKEKGFEKTSLMNIYATRQ